MVGVARGVSVGCVALVVAATPAEGGWGGLGRVYVYAAAAVANPPPPPPRSTPPQTNVVGVGRYVRHDHCKTDAEQERDSLLLAAGERGWVARGRRAWLVQTVQVRLLVPNLRLLSRVGGGDVGSRLTRGSHRRAIGTGPRGESCSSSRSSSLPGSSALWESGRRRGAAGSRC